MNPESLVLQPKVMEVRRPPQIGRWLQIHVTGVHTLTGYFSWLGSSCCPASVWRICPPVVVRPSAGQTVWNGGNVVSLKQNRTQWHLPAHRITETPHYANAFMRTHPRPQLLSISERCNPSVTSIKNTDPLTVAVAPFLSPSGMARSVLTCPLLPCLSFFSFSLCRFTLTYRELILLFLFFNKLLFKRWDPSRSTHNALRVAGFPLLPKGRSANHLNPGITPIWSFSALGKNAVKWNMGLIKLCHRNIFRFLSALALEKDKPSLWHIARCCYESTN